MENEEIEFLKYVKKISRSLTTTELASIYRISAKKFNILLEDLGIQYKRRYNGREKWILKREFQNKGLQEVGFYTYKKQDGEIMNFRKQPKWTKRGIIYIYYYLKQKGIKPTLLIENENDDIEEKIEQLSFI